MRMTRHTAQNGSQMRLLNRLRILQLIRRGAVARSELAAETGLTRAGISVIVSGLLKEGLLLESGCRGSAGGRKPVLLELRPEYGCALGLTISRAGAEVGVVNFKGELLWQSPLSALEPVRNAALTEIREELSNPIYCVHGTILLRDNQRPRPVREVVVLVIKENGEWKLGPPAPAAIKQRIMGTDEPAGDLVNPAIFDRPASEPSTAPAEP